MAARRFAARSMARGAAARQAPGWRSASARRGAARDRRYPGGMLLSAIVLCCDSGRHIGAALRSLAADCGRLAAPCEILVVDNGSRDESPTLLAQLAAELGGLLRVIRLPRNMGTSVARNVALRTARGRAILIMDSDAVVPAGCLGALLARLDAAPQAGLVAPRLVHADGRPQLSADIFPTLPRKLRRLAGLRRLERALPPPDGALRRVDYAISAFWLLPRATIARVGLFDERFAYAPEDADYCIRIWAAGLEVLQDGSVVAIHDAREASRRLRPRLALRHVAGLAALFRKHRYLFGTTRLYRRLGMTGPT